MFCGGLEAGGAPGKGADLESSPVPSIAVAVFRRVAGPDNWGADTTSDGDRIVWVRLDLPGERLPDPGRAPMSAS